MIRKTRTLALVIILSLLVCGLVWAALELAGQSNKSAADAGSSAADMEMASLDSIKPSTKAPAAGANKESSLRSKIARADSAYKSRLSKAKAEIASTGKVSSGTRSAGMSAAQSYKAANDEYAAYWDSQNCASRARLAREIGQSRVKSAEMAFNDVSSDRVDAYNRQQDSLRSAQSAYLKDAKTDVSDADRAVIKSGMTSSLKKVGSDLTGLLGTVSGLLGQVQQQVGGTGLSLSPSSIGGCARQAASSGASALTSSPAAPAAAAEGAAALLSPLKSLFSLLKSMSSNVSGMLSDVSSL